MRLDIYLPKYNAAIECHGIQHFYPIEFFVGEEQLKDKEEGDFQVYSYFVPTVDPETGELTLKQVVGTKEALGKIELAGASTVNSYGIKSQKS